VSAHSQQSKSATGSFGPGYAMILLIAVIALLPVYTAIEMDHYNKDQKVNFHKHFGPRLTNGRDLSSSEKKFLQPIIAARLEEICADPTPELAAVQDELVRLFAQPSPTDPKDVAARFKHLSGLETTITTLKGKNARNCLEARKAALWAGVLPAQL
jgi:hypothetical protein